MGFEITLDPSAVKELLKISKGSPTISSGIKQAINSLSNEPYAGKPLAGNKKGCFSLRKGDHRVIYEVYPQRQIIHIIQVGHRREVYR